MFPGMMAIALGAVVICCGVWLVMDTTSDEKPLQFLQVNEFSVSAQQYKDDTAKITIIITNIKGFGKAMTFDTDLQMLRSSSVMDLNTQQENISGEE